MAELQEFKCPCCGGAIGFDSTIQKMKCPYCDTEFDIETLISYDRELKNERPEDLTWETQAGGRWQEGETDGLRSYICNSRDEKSRTFSSNPKISYILRTSSRSIRLILSSIVSLAVSLKWTRTI